MSETIVITGGSGFLGSHLSERLPADGCRVICLDNFCTGTPDNGGSRGANRKRARRIVRKHDRKCRVASHLGGGPGCASCYALAGHAA